MSTFNFRATQRATQITAAVLSLAVVTACAPHKQMPPSKSSDAQGQTKAPAAKVETPQTVSIQDQTMKSVSEMILGGMQSETAVFDIQSTADYSLLPNNFYTVTIKEKAIDVTAVQTTFFAKNDKSSVVFRNLREGEIKAGLDVASYVTAEILKTKSLSNIELNEIPVGHMPVKHEYVMNVLNTTYQAGIKDVSVSRLVAVNAALKSIGLESVQALIDRATSKALESEKALAPAERINSIKARIVTEEKILSEIKAETLVLERAFDGDKGSPANGKLNVYGFALAINAGELTESEQKIAALKAEVETLEKQIAKAAADKAAADKAAADKAAAAPAEAPAAKK